jgi:hypothetical protein
LIQAYLIHIADKSDANFRKILEIKGIRSKQEQGRLAELFHVHRNSERHAQNLQQSNPLIAQLQPPAATTTAPSSSVTQGLGLSTSTTSALGSSAVRFDASTLGSALISAAREGVDRIGTTATTGTTGTGAGLASGSSTQSGSGTPTIGLGGSNGFRVEAPDSGSAAANLNENLKNIGKFFRRDLGGFGGRFGRSGDER